METAAQELARAFDVAASEVLTRKETRKLLRAMELFLETHIPENGIGPICGARRDALQILRSAERWANAERSKAL